MSVYLKPGMQSHHMLGNSPSNLLGNVSTSLAQPGVMEPTTQPLTADPSAQPADAYVVKHQPVKRHLGQRGGLVGGVLLTAGLLLGAASLTEPTVDIDHTPEGITRFLDGEVPGLGNTEMTSAQLFAELDGEMVPMEVVSSMHSDLLSGGTLASAGTNLATLLAAAKPKGKWGKFKNWASKTKAVKWSKKKLKKPAGWVKKHPFAAMGTMAALFLLNLILLRKWMKASANKSGKKIYLNDIPQGYYFDTGTIFVANNLNDKGGYQVIRSSRPQRDVLVKFTKDPQRKLVDVLNEVYPRRRDEAERNTAHDNTVEEIVKKRGWLMEMPTQPGEDKGYTLTLTPYKVGRLKRRWRYWRCTRRDNKLDWARWLVEEDRKKETLPWANRWVGWVPGGMSLKKANKIVTKANETIVVSNPEIVGSIGNGMLTNPRPNIFYTVKGDSYIIHRPNKDPGSLSGWQADVFHSCENQDPGPKLSILLLPFRKKDSKASEEEVKNFLGRLVDEGIMVEEHGYYRVYIPKGTADDTKRISGDKEPVAFYTPPQPKPKPKPKPQKPEYKMTRDGSTMFIAMPNGDVETVGGWKLRALGVARVSSPDEAKTIDEIFEGIGRTADDHPEFSLFIHTAIANKWLLDLGESRVMFVLEEGDFIPPKSPAPRHPKSVPAIKKGSETGEWTGVMNEAEAEKEAVKRTPEDDPAAKPSSPPKATPPVGIGVQVPKRALTPVEAAKTMAGGFDVKPAGSAKIPHAPDAPAVQAKSLVPPLVLPDDEPAVHAAESVTAPPAQPETEDVVELVADLPEPLGRDSTSTVLLTPSTAVSLASDSEPQTMRPTKVKLRAGTETDPQLLTNRVVPAALKPATVAVTFDTPADTELADDDQSTGRFREPGVPPTPPAEAFPGDKRPTGMHDPAMAGAVAGQAQPPAIPSDAELTMEFDRAQVKAALAKADAAEGAQPPPTPESLPLSERKVSGKVEGAPPRARAKRPGEDRMTIRKDPEGVAGHTMQLKASDLVKVSDGDGDGDGDGSDEG